MASIEELLVVIDSSTERLRRELKQGNREVETFRRRTDRQLSRIDKRFARLSRTVGRTTKSFAALAGVGSAGLFGTKVLTQFADFDRSMVRINTLVGISEEQVNAWRKELIELAPAVGKTPGELADALFFVTSAGLRGTDAIETLTAAAKGSAIGLGETKAIALAAASAMNAYGSANLDAKKAAAIVFGAVRAGNLDAETLAGTIGQVISVASEMGVTFDQVTATIAALSTTGSTAEIATTQLAATLSSLLKPSEGQIKAAKAINLSFEEMRRKLKEEGLLSLLLELKRRYDGNAVALAQVFPNVRALKGVLALVGENAGANKAIFKALEDQTIETFEKAFGIQAVSASGKLDRAVAKLNTLLNSLGEDVVPPAVAAIEAIGDGFRGAADQIDDFLKRFPAVKKAIEFGVNTSVSAIDSFFSIPFGGTSETPLLPTRKLEPPNIGISAEGTGMSSLRILDEIDEKLQGVGRSAKQMNEEIDILPERLREMQDELERVKEIGDSVAGSLDDAFSDFLDNGKLNFKQFADSAIKDLLRIVFQQNVTRPLGTAIAGGLQGFGFPLGPGRASGGPVVPGVAYPVGERGRETFIPTVPGVVVPHQSSAGPGGAMPNVEINIVTPPGTTARQTGSRRTEGGISADILIEQVDSALGERITDGRSATGEAVRSRFGLSPGNGRR